MLLASAVGLATRPRCFGCRTPGWWLCPGCLAELEAPRRTDPIDGADRVVVPWAYEGAARDLVLALKLRARRPAAAVLGEAVAHRLHASGSGTEVITWVPGRRKDIRVRGFDHAELIAREVGLRTGLPVVEMLRRGLDRPDQTTLSGSARRANLKGVFLAERPPSNVLVVDDLVTTGATASACSGALRDRGTTYVEVAAPCRA